MLSLLFGSIADLYSIVEWSPHTVSHVTRTLVAMAVALVM